jgi:hypothetical protein
MARNKSLGAFKDHELYFYERTRGMNGGYLSSMVARIAFLAQQVDFGHEQQAITRKDDSFRDFTRAYIRWQNRVILEALKETPRKVFSGNRERKDMLRQLIALRLFRARMNEEATKGDKTYPKIKTP